MIFKLIRLWRTRRAMRSWHEEHGGLPDEILEDFNSLNEASMDYKQFWIQAALAALRHLMTASPFAAMVTDDWLLQTATILVGVGGYLWSIKRKAAAAAQ